MERRKVMRNILSRDYDTLPFTVPGNNLPARFGPVVSYICILWELQEVET
jgi:hypothetical protein